MMQCAQDPLNFVRLLTTFPTISFNPLNLPMSKGLPYSEREFQKAWPRFKDWLIEHGSAIFEPTNPYEIARFLTDSGIGVIYINKSGRVTNWINNSDVAYEAFASLK